MEKITPFCTGNAVLLKRKTPLSKNAFSFSLPTTATLVALVGRNGAGKTTLLHAILGEPYLAAGEIHLLQNALPTQKMHAKDISQIVAFVPQEHSYPSHFSGLELLRFALLSKSGIFSAPPSENHPTILELVENLELGGILRKTLSQMSSGERQKMFLASALIKSPRILLLDEPTNHLDPAATHAFWRTLSQNASGRHVILSTHDLGFIASSCDYVVVLEGGTLSFAGSKTEFFEKEIPKKIFLLGG